MLANGVQPLLAICYKLYAICHTPSTRLALLGSMCYTTLYMGTNLKKALFSLFSTAFLFNLSIPAGFPAVAVAETLPSAGETRIERDREGVIRDLGVETTGILPSNPFYFFKEWGRGIRKALSFSPLKRAELQLDIANEQAAEIAKLLELGIESKDAYIRALQNYEISLALVRERLSALRGTTVPDRFSLVLIDRALKHGDILDTLYAAEEGEEGAHVREGARAAREAAAKTVASLAAVLGNTERIAGYVRTVTGKQSGRWRELKAVEFLNRLEALLPGQNAEELAKLRAHLLLQLAGRLSGATLDDFAASDDALEDALESVPGVSLERLRALDALREYAADSDIRNYISLIRSKLFDRMRSGSAVTESDARALLAEVAETLAKVDVLLGEKKRVFAPAVRQGAERAKFAKESAEKFLEEESFAASYGQSSAALAAVERAYADIVLGNGDMTKDVQALKFDFDNLGERIRASGASKTDAPELFAAMNDAERAVAKVADLISAEASAERVLDGVRLAKRLIGAATALLENKNTAAEAPRAPAAEPGGVSGATTVVMIADGQFVPAVAKVKKGDTVAWKNADANAHWITASVAAGRETLAGLDAGSAVPPGGEYRFTFERRGMWKYYDKLHPEMTGVVDVE